MPNWSVKATAVAINAVNPTNIDVTFTATNSSTNEVVTQVSPNVRWTLEKAQAYAQGMIDGLNTRDAAKTANVSVLSGFQAAIGQSGLQLATG